MTTEQKDRAIIVKDTDGARKALISRFGSDEFGQALPVHYFIALCNKVGLNPWMGHIIPFEGRPYVQHDGWLHLINREAPGQLVKLESRPATQEEYQRFRVPAGYYFALATVVRKWPNGNEVTYSRRAIVTDREAAPSEKETGKRRARHIVEDPWDMAEKRARTRALRMAFNDCMQRAAAELADQVDTETGEIIEGEVISEGDWSRLWVSAHELGMDKAAVHDFFGVPPEDGALKDYATAKAQEKNVALQQVIEDMADEIRIPAGAGQTPEDTIARNREDAGP